MKNRTNHAIMAACCCLFIFFSGTDIFGEEITIQRNGPGVVEAAAVSVSSSTAQNAPGYFLIDGDSSTGWGPGGGAGECRAQLELATASLVVGAELSGSFGPGDRLVLEYLDGGGWVPFAGGFLEGAELDRAAAGAFYDLSLEGAVTDTVRIRLLSPGGAMITEAAVIGIDAGEVPHTLRPVLIEETDNISPFYPAWHLLDGNTRTAFRTISPPFFEEVLETILSLSDERTGIPRHTVPAPGESAEITMRFAPGTAVSVIRLYFRDGARGNTIVETGLQGVFTQAAVISEGSTAGWTAVSLATGPENAVVMDAIRITVEGSGFGLGGISEAEVWGYGDYRGAERRTIAGTEQRLLDGDVNAVFYVDNVTVRDRTAIEVLCRGGVDMPMEINLNGKVYSRMPDMETGGNTLYRFEADGDDFVRGKNCLRIGAIDDGTGEAAEVLCARVAVERRDGEIAPFAVQRSLAAAFGAGEADIGTGETMLLHEAEVRHTEGVFTDIFAEADQTWTGLEPTGEGPYHHRFAPAGGEPITTRRLRVMKDPAGRTAGMRVLGSPVTDGPPEVRFVNPADGDEIASGDVPFVICYTDDPGAVVFINGFPAFKRGNYHWTPLMWLDDWEDGSLTIEAAATGAGGMTAETAITVYRAPGVLFSTDLPDETIHTVSDSIEVTGSVLNTLIDITVNGIQAAVSQKRFSVTVNLDEGLNTITIYGKHRTSGMEGVIRRQVVRYGGGLVLDVEYPEDGWHTRAGEVIVSGTATGAGETVVSVNGVPAIVEGSRFYSEPAALSEGENTIAVTAEDGAGRQATGTLTVYRDTIPPDITGITPGDGALVASSVVTFEITLEETGPVWVTVNGQPCIKEGNIHTAELVFPDGCRQVRITAGDAAGNVSEGLVTLTTDTTPPVEFGVTAEPAGWTNDNRPVLTFETEDEVSGISGYSVSVDGGGFEAAESPYMLPPLTDGEHLVTVTATDHAGWERYAFTSVYIDTTPPEEISGFKVIPGNGKAIVEWEGGEEDVDRYELERIPEPDGGIVILEAPGYTDGGLINGETYSYRVRAIDRAENAGEYTGWTAIESGIEREPYDPEGTTVAEFDGVTIYLPAQDGDEGIACIEIYEEQAEGIPETAVNPIVSPMYEIHPVDSNGRKILEGNGIANDYVAAIRYDELMIPEGKREDELGVYYFDAVWGRWFIIDNYVVDRENNRIYFSSDHFSLYTVQATVSQDLGTEEYAEAGYSPFRTYAVHGSLAVSQKGGSVHNNVTELVLPGPAGFDLAISRRYDTSTGVSDSRITADIDTSGNNVDLTPYLKNQGDVTYSMGNGWRLELPYIKNAGSCEILVLPGGSMHSFFDMKIEEEDSDDEEVSVLSLTPRDKEEFKLKVTREKVTYFKNSHYYEEYETWKNNGYVLSMKDGTSYTLDDTGRCTKIADPTGLNTITVTYKSGEGVYKIDYIEDALGRKVRFEYTTIHDLPYIKNISVDGDPYERTVTYTQDQNGMLTEANDAGGRIWRYDYAEILINASPGPAPFSLTDALNKLGDSERRETSKEINEALESYNDGQEIFHHARLLSGLRGPGKGIITVIYGINTIDDRLFPQANEIVIYPDGERSELNLPQRRTIYEYMMDEEAVPDGDGEVNPDRTKRYLKETRERDGSRETVYTYEPYITEKNRWKLGEEGEIEEAKKKGYDVATRISSIARTEPAGGNVLERTVFTYPEERQTARPAGKTVYHGDGNYIRTTYDYDEYGNVVKAEEYGTTGGRENRLVKKMIYRGGLSSMQPSGGETEPPNYDDAWKPYGEPGGNDDDGFSVPDMTMYKNDILLAVLTLNYVPAFDDNGNLDEDGETVSYQYAYYEYDEKGQVKRNAVWDSGNETWRISAFTYDYETAGGNEYGNVVSQTDPREHVTTFSYDANGYMTKRTEKDVCNADALDGDATNDTYTDITTAYGYEAASGWLRWTRNPRGYVTEYEYDKLGRTTAIVEPDDDDAADYTPLNGRPDNPETVLSYGDTAGDLYAEVVDPEGSKTRYGFDDYGQLTGVIKYTRDEGGVYGEYSTTHLTYNRWGDIATITDPNGNTTAFGYDPMGRRNLIVYPDGNTNRNDNPAKHLDFDYSDNILTVTDENGKISSILNDMKGRVLETTQHNGGETITTETYYDGAGNTIAVKGPKDGFFVMNEYDSRNRLAHTIMPEEEFYENGESVSVKPEIWYAYDETGNKVSEAYGAPDGEWRITCYAYDEAGRTIQATQMNLDGEGEETILARRRSYYDANGNITREVDANNV
ncbi:MAG: hypothetical protein JW881_19335, partial [Spirochaetales bacterium]|nr:hypothetical protein [Spirochaetales bacterium]